MKKRLWLILLAGVMIVLTACSGYTSHYSATACVRTNTTKEASIRFSSFEGTMVFQMKCGDMAEKIHYSATLESGDVTVYYDCDGTKMELFSISSGETVADVGGILCEGTVYLLVEATERHETVSSPSSSNNQNNSV